MSTDLLTRERLGLFEQKVRELYDRRLVRAGMNTELTISWDAVSQLLRQTTLEPDEEDLRSFLLIFRQFISDKEPVFVQRIFGDCMRFLESSELREELKKAQAEWKQVLNKIGVIHIVIDDRKLTGEYVLDLWLNGHYFHNDSDKAAELNRYVSSGNLAMVRMQFLSVLSALTQIIGYLGSVVSYGLRSGLFRFPDDEG